MLRPSNRGTTPTSSIETMSLRFSPHPSGLEKGRQVIVIGARMM